MRARRGWWPGNSRASDERLPVVEHHRLPWRGRPEWIVERKRCCAASEARHRALRKYTAVSNARQTLHLGARGDEPFWRCRFY